MATWGHTGLHRWLSGVVVTMSNLQSWVGIPITSLPVIFLRFLVDYLGDVTTTQVNSALHPFEVVKSSTSFGQGKGGEVTSAGGNTL